MVFAHWLGRQQVKQRGLLWLPRYRDRGACWADTLPRASVLPPQLHRLPHLRVWSFSLGAPTRLAHPASLQEAHSQEPARVCAERQSGARGSVPGEKPGFGKQRALKWRLEDRKLSPHPASSPTAGTRPGNREKGNLVFSCFALNPSLSPSLGQLLSSPHPAPTPTPTPKDSRSGESQGPARILTAPHTSWLPWPLTLASSRSSRTH